MRNAIGLSVVLILLFMGGCIGGKPQETPAPTTAPPATAPPEVTEAPTTTAPAPTTEPPTTTTAPTTTVPPATTAPPAPADKYSLQTTSPDGVLPPGASKLEPMGGDYDSVLKFPVNIGTLVDSTKATYFGQTAGTIYVLKYTSPDHAEDVFKNLVEKSSLQGKPLMEKTLSSGGKSLKVYHRIEFTKYLATLFRRGIFIVYVDVSNDEFAAEQYITTNMIDLFDSEPPAQPIPLTTRPVDFLSASTSARDVIPQGASSTTSISSAEYQFTLSYPATKPSSYREDIKATYAVPDGAIYVSKFDSASEAETFLNEIIAKYSRGGSVPLKKVLTADGKSLTVHHRIDGVYKGTIIQKGLFVYYVAVTKDDFDAEYYLPRKMGYLFQ